MQIALYFFAFALLIGVGADLVLEDGTALKADAESPEPAVSTSGTATGGQTAAGREVRLERLRPREIERAMQTCPVLFQPLGTIEWHGLHNIAGLDAVKAHHLCVRVRGGVIGGA